MRMRLPIRLWATALFLAWGIAPGFSYVCPVPPPAVLQAEGKGYYVDEQRSIPDPARVRENARLAAPVKAFEETLARSATAAQQGESGAAPCVGTLLADWARQDALLEPPKTPQGQFIRRWATAAAAMSLLRAEGGIPSADEDVIRPWLRQLAGEVGMSPNLAAGRRNNHFYWAAFAVGAVGVATEDPALIDRARTAYRNALSDIQADGHLPRESRRGIAAWRYHDFSALPLVMLAELGARIGEDWYAYDDGALHRLAGFVLEGYRDPDVVAEVSGVAPEIKNLQRRLDWYPLYARRFPEKVNAYGDLGLDQLEYWEPRIGGDMRILADEWVQ